jgi:hypothetical protein
MTPIRFKALGKKFSPKKGLFFWYRYYKVMFFFGFLIVLGAGGYFWHYNLYRHQWSDQEKKAFIESNFKETVFKEKEFVKLVESLKKRESRSQEALPLTHDIFTGVRYK